VAFSIIRQGRKLKNTSTLKLKLLKTNGTLKLKAINNFQNYLPRKPETSIAETVKKFSRCDKSLQEGKTCSHTLTSGPSAGVPSPCYGVEQEIQPIGM
jgi:hypothetical protein